MLCVSATDWLGAGSTVSGRKRISPSERSCRPLKRRLAQAVATNFDQASAKEIRAVSRPGARRRRVLRRLTVALLLKRSGATAAQNERRTHHLTLTLAAALAHAESEDSLGKRKLAGGP
jgi:hypothetical protein